MIAHRHTGDTGTHFHHDTRAFMAQNGSGIAPFFVVRDGAAAVAGTPVPCASAVDLFPASSLNFLSASRAIR